MSKINANALAFLERYSPNDLAALRDRFPDRLAYLQSSGVVLGDAESEVLRQSCITAMAALSRTSETACKAAVKRLESARRLELLGAVATLAASGGVVGAALGFQSTDTAGFFGLLGFISTGVPLGVNWLKGSASGASVADAVIKLREFAWDAKTLKADLERGDATPESSTLARVNSLAKATYMVLGDLGFDSEIQPV